MPRKVRELLKEYKKNGFYVEKGAGKGDHRKLRHKDYTLRRPIILDGKSGSDSLKYQEKDLKEKLQWLKEQQDNED